MDYDGEYEFIPLPTIPNDAIPEAMKEFISQCGMIGVLPRHNIVEIVSKMEPESMEIIEADKEICFKNKIMSRQGDGEIRIENGISCKEEFYDNVDIKIDNIIVAMEKNNMGIFKFLEANGMNPDKAKKFIRRVVRLTLNYK